MADKTIAYTEEMVGSGNPIKTDTLNRLALVGHNTDGTHNAEVLAIIEDYLPWMIDIDVFPTSKSNTGWDSISVNVLDIHCGVKYSSGAQNDWISWDVILAAGTWTVRILHAPDAHRGVYSVQFDSVEKGTIDGYSAGSAYNVQGAVTGIVVPTTAKIELKLKMATKNGLSDSYIGSINSVKLIRTV